MVCVGVRRYPLEIVMKQVDSAMYKFCAAARNARPEALLWPESDAGRSIVVDYFAGKEIRINRAAIIAEMLQPGYVGQPGYGTPVGKRNHQQQRGNQGRNQNQSPGNPTLFGNRGVKSPGKLDSEQSATNKPEGGGLCLYNVAFQVGAVAKDCVNGSTCPRAHKVFDKTQAAATAAALDRLRIDGPMARLRDDVVKRVLEANGK